MVLASVLIQGSTIRWWAIRLGVDRPAPATRHHPIEMEPVQDLGATLTEIDISYESAWGGQCMATIGLPPSCWVVMCCRGGKWSLPSAQSVMEGGDQWILAIAKHWKRV
ncbi:hypothetical protein EBZ35_07075 [bacterium]|nr:hypothetical protein [bacterium]